MKKTSTWWLVLAAAGGVAGCATSDSTVAPHAPDAALTGTPKVHVVFANPQNYTDARSRLGGDADPRNLDPLGEFLVREASKHLRPGEHLIVAFHDVDLAGDFEVGGLSPTGDLRIMREIYPPRLEFRFSILDETDTVVQEGKVTLTNRAFLRELRLAQSSEPLEHEKKLLRDWVRKTLATRKDSPKDSASADDKDAP